LKLSFGEIDKIAKNSTITKAREKISTDLESFKFKRLFHLGLAKFKKKSKFT
jgi:hypothetical protein